MSLQVVKVKTGFKDDGSVHPLVVNRRTRSFEDLVNGMSSGTAIPKSDMLSMWEQEVKVIKTFLKEGYRVQTPLGDLMIGVKNSAKVKDDSFQIDSSGLHLIFHASDVLLDELKRETKIQVLDANPPKAPMITRVTNPRNGDSPDSAHAGKVVNLNGARLRFESEDSECGVFFWNGGGREAAIRATTYSHLGTSRIGVEVPDDLPPGEYTMEVRTRPTKKDIRVGIYEKKIKVETL